MTCGIRDSRWLDSIRLRASMLAIVCAASLVPASPESEARFLRMWHDNDGKISDGGREGEGHYTLLRGFRS